MNMLTYNNGQPSLLVSNPTQPVYTIAYRANNNGNILAPNIVSGPAAATYVTAGRTQIADMNSPDSDSDHPDKDYQPVSRRHKLKKVHSIVRMFFHEYFSLLDQCE